MAVARQNESNKIREKKAVSSIEKKIEQNKRDIFVFIRFGEGQFCVSLREF